MKICITTTFDRAYALAGKTMIKSVRHHTDCRGVDFKVITADPEVVKEFGAEHCHFVDDSIKARYRNVAYSKELPPERYAHSWYRYELFNFQGYDRVICIDSDCLCVNDLSYLFSEELNQFDLISVEDHIVSKCFIHFVPELERQGLNFRTLNQRMQEAKIDIQPALIVANRPLLGGPWYQRLLEFANRTGFTYSIDEGILNDFIYRDNLRVKLLPLEYDYQDLYEIHCPTLPVPSHPVIVHCQESKPFKKSKSVIDPRMHKWHDRWWQEHNHVPTKTVVVIIVFNRFHNLQRWLNAWKQCHYHHSELVVIHNLETDSSKYEKLCQENGVHYVPRKNVGFDMGAFQDVCKKRLAGFPNDWDNLIWITDDCFPLHQDFVGLYLQKLSEGCLPCYEISNEVKRHVRTTGFMVTRDIADRLSFPADPITTRQQCYTLEHLGFTLHDQIKQMGKEPCMVVPDLRSSPLWDSGCRSHLGLMPRHEQVFPFLSNESVSVTPNTEPPKSLGMLDDLAIKHQADKSSRYHNLAVKYERLLGALKQSFTAILEIGVAQGQSLKMWADYFPNAIIHGADISLVDRSCESYCKRIQLHLTDQSNEAQLKNLEQFAPFDFILDDGNHWWHEQILSFQTLFPFVKKGGIYVVEDSCTSYWPEYKNHSISPVEYFKRLVDDVNLRGARGRKPDQPPPEFGQWEKGWHRREDCHVNLPAFESIHFLNSLIVIYKR